MYIATNKNCTKEQKNNSLSLRTGRKGKKRGGDEIRGKGEERARERRSEGERESRREEGRREGGREGGMD